MPPSAPRRGRPSKFGRPSQVVALTLPDEVIRALRRRNADLGWAIVSLVEQSLHDAGRPPAVPDWALATIQGRQSLIVVSRQALRALPGVNIIPLDGDRAFLALEPGRGMSDLELAVLDRLDDPTVDTAERRTLAGLRRQLRAWRRDPRLEFESRAIIVVGRRKTSRRAISSK